MIGEEQKQVLRMLKEGQDFSEPRDSYMVFITRTDIFGQRDLNEGVVRAVAKAIRKGKYRLITGD